ncbi:MAG TPA: DUF302 domain-containing protein [Candidatus Acidoferrales bacterium]|nr:DUF302 domain-containing protein [Candidatus Acidoferrales bacterium]
MSESVVKVSRYSYAETVERLVAAIAAAGSTLFAKIDQSAAAQSVGLHLRPTTLLLFGNPRGGTPLMEASPLIALDLPLRLLVWEEQGVQVAYTTVQVLAQRYGLTGKEALVSALDRALDTLAGSVS